MIIFTKYVEWYPRSQQALPIWNVRGRGSSVLYIQLKLGDHEATYKNTKTSNVQYLSRNYIFSVNSFFFSCYIWLLNCSCCFKLQSVFFTEEILIRPLLFIQSPHTLAGLYRLRFSFSKRLCVSLLMVYRRLHMCAVKNGPAHPCVFLFRKRFMTAVAIFVARVYSTVCLFALRDVFWRSVVFDVLIFFFFPQKIFFHILVHLDKLHFSFVSSLFIIFVFFFCCRQNRGWSDYLGEMGILTTLLWCSVKPQKMSGEQERWTDGVEEGGVVWL